jgi:hypothetical protein
MPGSYAGVGHARLFATTENKILVSIRTKETKAGKSGRSCEPL